jgi:hypothetical protein
VTLTVNTLGCRGRDIGFKPKASSPANEARGHHRPIGASNGRFPVSHCVCFVCHEESEIENRKLK